MQVGRLNGLMTPTNLFVTLTTHHTCLVTFLTLRNQLPRLTALKMRYISLFSFIIISSCRQGDSNIFDNLPSLSKLNATNECDELDLYLAASVEDITSGDALKWWHNHRSTYPCLSCMALNYLTIPGKYLNANSDPILIYTIATSVEVEHLFSKGHITLPYLRNHLSSHSTHALMSLGQWSKLSLVKDGDIHKATCDEVEEIAG